jgi:hypothetical protein
VLGHFSMLPMPCPGPADSKEGCPNKVTDAIYWVSDKYPCPFSKDKPTCVDCLRGVTAVGIRRLAGVQELVDLIHTSGLMTTCRFNRMYSLRMELAVRDWPQFHLGLCPRVLR